MRTAGFAFAISMTLGHAVETSFPPNVDIVSVRDYGAKGDGIADDTRSIQAAVSANLLSYRYLYFPRGTYLISSPIEWKLDTSSAPCRESNRCWSNGLSLFGQERANTVIRVRDSLPLFQGKQEPVGVFITASGPFSGTSTGDKGFPLNNGFGNSIENITIDIGMGNPGAVGIDYLANNVGTIRNVDILSRDRGYAGIMMTRHAIGPCLIKNVSITGFDYAIKAANVRSSFTMEYVTIKGQRIAGIATSGNNFSAKGIMSENRVPAFIETTPKEIAGPIPGFMVLIDSKLLKGGAESAILSPAHLFLRNVVTEGYPQSLNTGNASLPGGRVGEYHTGSRKALWQDARPLKSLGLPVEDAPEYWDNAPSHWALVPPPSTPSSNRANILAALASGKTTILFHPGRYDLDSSIIIKGKVRHIIGNGTFLNPGLSFHDPSLPRPMLIIDHDSPSLTLQSLIVSDWKNSDRGLICIEHASSHPLVLKDVRIWDKVMHTAYRAHAGAGDLFLEDVSNSSTTSWHFAPRQRIWARQLNLEGDSTKMFTHGANLWILGMKTESTGTVIDNRNRGSAELLGGYFLNWRPYSAPAFINEDANLSVSYFTDADKPECGYSIHVSEKRGRTRKLLTKDEVYGNIYRCAMPLFVSHATAPADLPSKGSK